MSRRFCNGDSAGTAAATAWRSASAATSEHKMAQDKEAAYQKPRQAAAASQTAAGRAPGSTWGTAGPTWRATSAAQIATLMLLNDLYTIEALDRVEAVPAEAYAVLTLNAAHAIFAGHFPGQPVVPGACQLQIIQEVLSHALCREYRLLQADQLKFLMPIDPRQYPRIKVTLRYSATRADASGEQLQVTATLLAGDTIFLKFTGTFRAG